MPIRSLPLKPSHLAAAIMLGLAVPGIGLAQDAASPPEGTARTLDTVTVTGSRIKRTEIETQLPITVLQKERIDALGISSAEQLLMFLNIAGNSSDNLASNAGIVSDEQRGNNGVSGANLRGQGSNATETRWSCAPLPNPAVPADADSTLHRWSLIKNKAGTLGDWTVRWNGASAAFHLVSKAGERPGLAPPPL